MNGKKSLDPAWVAMMTEARALGMTPGQVREAIQMLKQSRHKPDHFKTLRLDRTHRVSRKAKGYIY